MLENPLSDILSSIPPTAIVAIIAALALKLLMDFGVARKKRARRSGNRQPARIDVTDPRDQMEYVSRVDFRRIPLLNGEERRVFECLERAVLATSPGFRVMAQTSLGEIIGPDPRSVSKEDADLARRSINSKRVDFAVFDEEHGLRLAVEYQGSGHYSGKAFMRDAVKREALRKAGVPFLEIAKGERPGELHDKVIRLLADPRAAAAPGARPEPPLTAMP